MRVLRYEPPTPRKAQNRGKGFAVGFTTLSNIEREEKKEVKNNTAKDKMSKKESFTKKTGPTKASPKKGAEKKIAAKKPTAKGNDKAHTSEASVKESL